MGGHDRRLVHIRLEEKPRGLVAHLTIDNESKLNAMNSELMGQFIEETARLATIDRLRAVILTGAGPKAFVGGADINEMAALKTPDQAKAFITRLHQCCDGVRSIPVPVIARIQGFALGAGLELAASCDLRIASGNAVFGMPEIKLGIPSVIEAALLPMLIGWGRTREMLLLGEKFTAQEALEWGLIERIAPPSELDAAVDDWIEKILTSSPHAVRLQKALIRAWEDLPAGAAVAAGIDAFAAAFETTEPAAAMSEFIAQQKRRKRENRK